MSPSAPLTHPSEVIPRALATLLRIFGDVRPSGEVVALLGAGPG